MIAAVDIPWQVEQPVAQGGSRPGISEFEKGFDREPGFSAGQTIVAGTSAESLAHEMADHAKDLNFVRWHSVLGRKPLLLVTADDGLRGGSDALAGAIRQDGGLTPTTRHIATDHSFLPSFTMRPRHARQAMR